jgi:hypothetical protein
MPAKWKDLLAGLPASIEEAVTNASRETAEALNQAVRRIAQSSNVTDALTALVDSVAQMSTSSVVLSLEDGTAEALRKRGTAKSDIRFPIADAPALASLLATKEPVTAAPTPAEISQPLVDAFGQAIGGPEGRTYFFPIKVRNEVVVALVAAGAIDLGAVECLAEAASLKMEILLPPAPPPPPPPPPAPVPEVTQINQAPSAWDSLSAESQKVHLQAQRFARVKVAELRLYHADAVRNGRSVSDIYGVLQKEIDTLRSEFQKQFVAKEPTMVDYLHLELLRSLAHDGDRTLGPQYPGPLV